MGTRADFYVGRGPDAEWIGSIAMDGYPADGEGERAGIPWRLFRLTSEANWRAAVEDYIASKSHGTKPSEGWPWPWDDSHTTDCSYTFADGKVYASRWGRAWHDPIARAEWIAAHPDESDEDVAEHARLFFDSNGAKVPFPDMSKVAAPTIGPRSGMIVVGVR